MKVIISLGIVALLALTLVLALATSVSAHTTFPLTRTPNASVFAFRGRVAFVPGAVVCHAQYNCLTITNRTSNSIELYLNGRPYDPMWSGETINPTLPYGRDIITVPHLSRFAALVVIVQRPMPVCRFRCFGGGRF